MPLNRSLCAVLVLSWCLASGLMPSRASAGEVWLGHAIPGTSAAPTKRVVSMQERKFLNLVRQQTDYSCGAAAVATILKYAYGIDTSEAEVLEAMLRLADTEEVLSKGFSLLDMKRYAEAIGMNAIGFSLSPENLEEIKIPTIMLLDIRGYRHFVVFKKASGDRVYVADPALGNKVMTRQDFIAGWNGIVFAIVGESYDETTVLRRPAEPLSARRLLERHVPVLDVQPYEADMLRATLF